MIELTKERRAELRALSVAASTDSNGDSDWYQERHVLDALLMARGDESAIGPEVEDARFMAGVSPKLVISLLDALDAAESRSPSADEVAGLMDDVQWLRRSYSHDDEDEQKAFDKLAAFIKQAGPR